jgi:hypothetical protein
MKNPLRLLLGCTLLMASLAPAQNAQDTDFGLWTTLDLSKKLDNGLKLAFEEEYRLRNDLMTTDKFQSTFELSYKIGKHFTPGVSYTLINYYHPRDDEHAHNFWETRHRFNVFGEGELDFARFTLSVRERLQTTYRVLDSLSSAKINPKLMLRSKASLTYNIKGIPLEPFAFAEFHHLLNMQGDPMAYEKYRIGAGLKYTFNKTLSVKVGYLYTAESDKEEGEKANVLTVGFGYKF